MSITPKYTLEQLKKLAKNYILFNTDMTRAILDDRKDQTRRVPKVKINSIINNSVVRFCNDGVELGWGIDGFIEEYSKYQIGDILYVRETFTFGKKEMIRPENFWYIRNDLGNNIFYKADLNASFYDPDNICKWKPSIHMPKKYARLFIKITGVAIENLQDMESNSLTFILEGISSYKDGNPLNKYMSNVKGSKEIKDEFKNLWNSTTKDKNYKWDKNPPVFKYKFEVVRYA